MKFSKTVYGGAPMLQVKADEMHYVATRRGRASWLVSATSLRGGEPHTWTERSEAAVRTAIQRAVEGRRKMLNIAQPFALRLGLQVSFESQGGYAHFRVRPVVIGKLDESDVRRAPEEISAGPNDYVLGRAKSKHWMCPGLALSAFEIDSQGSNTDPDDARHLYGIVGHLRLQYVSTLDAARAAQWSRTLRYLDVPHPWSDSRDGAGFTAFVSAIAKRLRVKEFIIAPESDRIVPTAEGLAWLQTAIQRWSGYLPETQAIEQVTHV